MCRKGCGVIVGVDIAGRAAVGTILFFLCRKGALAPNEVSATGVVVAIAAASPVGSLALTPPRMPVRSWPDDDDTHDAAPPPLLPCRATTLTPPCDTNHFRRYCFTVSFRVPNPPLYFWIRIRIASRSACTLASAFSDLTCSSASSMARASVPSWLIRSRKLWACFGLRMMSISTSTRCKENQEVSVWIKGALPRAHR